MFKQIDYTMVIVSDMRRSVEFYRDKLGIPLKFESPDWTEFQTGATTLALHGGGILQQSVRNDQSKYAGTCSIGFNVDDVEKTYDELRAKGINFIMPPTQREGEGIKLAVCIDPDGLPISFAQMIRENRVKPRVWVMFGWIESSDCREYLVSKSSDPFGPFRAPN